jgi:hypothetical protein
MDSNISDLSPGAVSAYANAASARNEDSSVGLNTLTFHELGHETHFGEALTQQYPVTPTLSWPRERGASSAGSRMAGTVDAPFGCSHLFCEVYGGEGGIRTPDSLTTMPDFESGAFNRALPPLRCDGDEDFSYHYA